MFMAVYIRYKSFTEQLKNDIVSSQHNLVNAKESVVKAQKELDESKNKLVSLEVWLPTHDVTKCGSNPSKGYVSRTRSGFAG